MTMHSPLQTELSLATRMQMIMHSPPANRALISQRMQMIMHSPPANRALISQRMQMIIHALSTATRALIGYKDADDYAFSPCKQSSH